MEAPASATGEARAGARSGRKNPLGAIGAWLALALASAHPAVGAEGNAQPAVTTASAGETTLTLSPFEVSATPDTGYAGQDTLSGSRLRTNLRDVAAAISPMTADFLRDIAATNIEDAVEYGVGARIDTDDARAAGPVGDSYNNGVRSIRIRGLPGGGRSINFFGAQGEVDMYMTDSIEVSRGPNSILYGFGSPAGKINISTKQALLNKDAYTLTSRTDSWGGQRWVADGNLAPLKQKLGVRAVVLRGRESSWRASGHNDQDRVFLAAKWQLDRRTTLKVEFEHGEIDRYVPRPWFGNDRTSTWDANGQPIFNNFATTYIPGTPGTGATGTPGNPIRDSGTTNIVGVKERSGADYIVVSDRFAAAQNYRNFTVSDAPTDGLQASDFEMGRRNPKATIEANWVKGAFRVNNATAFFQRELVRDLNLEIAVNRQTSRGDTHNNIANYFAGVVADTNLYLPTGQLRPADQLYYFDTASYHVVSSAQANQGRVTLSFERSLRDLITVRVAGLGEMARTKSRSELKNQVFLKGPELSSGGAFNATPESSANGAIQRFYIKDLSVLNDPNFRIPGPIDLSGPTKYQDPRTGAISTIYMHEINNSSGIRYVDQETGAAMGVAQVFLLKNRIVGTFGYRKDRLISRVAVPVRDPAGEAIPPNIGVYAPVDPQTATPSIFSGQTRTNGVVVHLRPWLSAFINASSSFSLPGTSYITPSDPRKTTSADLVPSPSGKTTDYGLKLSLLKNRLFVTATTFHTISQKEYGGSGFATGKANLVNIWNALANSTALNAEETTFARRQFEIMSQVSGYTQDSESRGWELEIIGQPVPGWSVSINYSKNATTRSNIAPEYRAYIDTHKPYWKKYRDLSLSQNVNLPLPQKAPGFQDWNFAAIIASTGDFTANTDSINEAIVDAETAFFDNPHVFEGKRFVGDPLHSINLRTRFDFREGLIKGLSIGGGTRLRLGRVAGARSEYTFASGSDFTDTWNGRIIDKVTLASTKDQNVYDLQLSYALPMLSRKVRWSVQVNVNNVLDQRELIVNNVHPRTLAPLTYRYQDPRQFILTNTVSF